MREPAWAPDGKRLAVVYLDRIWTMQPDGREGASSTGSPAVEREPAWSPDGRRIAFAADRGRGFDIYVVTCPAAVTPAASCPSAWPMLEGDERSPSWTPDGPLVFAHRGHPATRSGISSSSIPARRCQKRMPCA